MITKTQNVVRADVKEALMKVHTMAAKAEDCLLSMQFAFIYNSETLLAPCREAVREIKSAEPELTEKLKGIARDNAEMKRYVSIPAHLLRIGEKLEEITGLIEKKIREHILFSDKAVRETIFLLQRLSEMLWTTSSMILARNTFLGMYIEEAVANISSLAEEYATLHEERLIEGLCLPVASSLYVNLLDAVKNIAWNMKEIGKHLVS